MDFNRRWHRNAAQRHKASREAKKKWTKAERIAYYMSNRHLPDYNQQQTVDRYDNRYKHLLHPSNHSHTLVAVAAAAQTENSNTSIVVRSYSYNMLYIEATNGGLTFSN